MEDDIDKQFKELFGDIKDIEAEIEAVKRYNNKYKNKGALRSQSQNNL